MSRVMMPPPPPGPSSASTRKLLGAAFISFGNHRYRIDLGALGALRIANAGHGVDGLFIRTGKRCGDQAHRSRDVAEILAIRRGHMQRGTGGDVETSLRVHGEAIAAA